MQCGFLPPARSRRLLPAAARESISCTRSTIPPPLDLRTDLPTASHEHVHRVQVRSRSLTPSAWPRHSTQATRRGRYFPTHPFQVQPTHSPIQHQPAPAFANCDSESGKRELETRRAVWQPARSTWRRRSTRRRRRRRPAQPSSSHPQAGRRRFALSCPFGWLPFNFPRTLSARRLLRARRPRFRGPRGSASARIRGFRAPSLRISVRFP